MNRSERRAVAANARTGKPKDYRKAEARDPLDETPASPLASITLVWLPELSQALGRSRYTIERWCREGKFPAPLKLTEQGCAWRLRDVEAWLDKAARTRKRRKPRGSLMQGDELVEYSRREAADA